MITVEKMLADLDYWIHLGLGDDIVRMPRQREEYQHLVKFWKKIGSNPEGIPELVLADLKNEVKKPVALRPTFYRILWIEIKRTLFRK